MALQPFVGPWPILQFRNHFYTVGRTPWTNDQPVAKPLPTRRTTQTHNKRTQTSMPLSGIRIHDPSVRPRGHCDRPYSNKYPEFGTVSYKHDSWEF
jgi:hypothetical protein